MAQRGSVRGTVYDTGNGEPLFGVTVVVAGTTTGAVSDFDGKFELSLEPGTYNLQVSFVSFEKITIEGVEIKSGEVTVLEQIWMTESVETLEAVVISAEVIRNSENALLTVKRKSPIVMDGISAASFSKMGDSDAAEAAKRVTGVSVEGGKYVFVRGLGDRYTKTTMNSVDIPGLDPDRNSLQIDIFPTNLIDNMMVMKSFVPELPADFTGGIVNIETKDFPEERVFSISAGVGFNPSMHFNKDFVTYEGSGTDFLGFDNGRRGLPSGAENDPIPSPAIPGSGTEQEISDFMRSWDPVLATQQQTSFMDYSFGVTYGDQKPVGADNKLGYILSMNYKNSTAFFDDAYYGEYQIPSTDPDIYELQKANIRQGPLGEREVLVGGLAGLAYKTQTSKYKLTLMHLQNGKSSAGNFFLENDDMAAGQSGYFAGSDILVYEQRSLTNALLNGVHNSEDGTWKIDWRISPTISKLTEPDIRNTTFTYQSDTLFAPGAGGVPSRSWRYLDELNMVGKVDFTRKYQFSGSEAKLKFGVSHVYKERDYKILSYSVNFFGLQPDWPGANPNDVFTDENLYPNGTVYMVSGVNNPNPNAYNSYLHNTGIYVSTEISPTENLKAIVGVRGENFGLWHTGRDVAWANGNSEGNNLDNEKVLDSFDLFPSVNLIYSLSEMQNLRLSYSKTIARPSFKEMSFAQIIDPISNRIFNGGLFPYEGEWDGKLSETRINNVDLRWEMFMTRGQLFSASFFYKKFDDPIELVRIRQAQTTSEFQPRNVGDGTVLGAEFEFRKSLEFVAPALEMFSINGNYTIVKSEITMTNTEFRSRENAARTGQEIKNTRKMAGQAPYIVNAGVSYENPEFGLDAGFFYNLKGATLAVVGGGLYPDVYAQPFHSLNFNLNKSLGPEGRSSITFSVDNILNDVREIDYVGYESANQTFTSFSPGTTFSVGYKFSL